MVTGTVLVLLLLAGGLWLWLGSPDDPETASGDGASVERVDAGATTADPSRDLPGLDTSDEVVRRMVGALSSHPRLAAWLATDELVRRFVRTVVTVAGGGSPRSELEFLAPEGEFRVRGSDESRVIDPASYGRYDRVTAVFTSLDTRGTARLYDRLRPLFQEAYRELGFREGSFDDALARAIDNLLAVPIPEGPIEVEPSGAEAFEFRDPRLEEASPAAKHLLRMGPENARRVQAKLRELAGALELPTLTPARG